MKLDMKAITEQLKELQRQERELKVIKDAEEAKVNQEKAKVAKSARLVLGYMEEFIDNRIKLGVLTRANVADYAVRLNRMTTPDRQVEVYVSLAIKLLSHEFYGVESHTKRLGNGSITWKAKEYPTVFTLYETIQGLLGDDPLGSVEWFYVVLDDLAKDPTRLPAEILIPERLTKLTQNLQKIASYSRIPLELLPDLDALTADDAMWLSAVTGM